MIGRGTGMAIKAILFDLDDTLLWDDRSVEEAFAATCQYAVEKVGKDQPQLLEEAVRREARSLYESYETFPFTKMIGINPFEGLWANFTGGNLAPFRELQRLAPNYRREAWTRGLRSVGIDDEGLGAELAQMFPRERRARAYVYEDTYAVLDELKQRYRLLLLTNGAPDLQQEKLDGVPKLISYFDHIVISGEFGEGKPAASIFRHAMSLLNIQPHEGLMVGDKLTTDILGSNIVGMPNAWINRHSVRRNDDIVPRYEISSLSEIHRVLQSLV